MIKKALFTLLLLSAFLMFSLAVYYLAASYQARSALALGSTLFTSTQGTLEYVVEGEGEPVLFLHGTPGGYDTFFSLENTQLIKLSRPGYLRSELNTPLSPEQQADSARQLLEALELDSVTVLAVSGGGPVALAFAKRFPEKTRALILIEAVSQKPPEKRARVLPMFESDFMSWLFISLMHLLPAEQVLEPIMPSAENRQRISQNPEKIQRMHEALWKFWPVSQRKAGQENDWHFFQTLSPDYQSIQTPALIIHGDRDLNVSIEQSLALAEQLPEAQLAVIEGADHFMTISHSEQITAMIEAFLNALNTHNNHKAQNLDSPADN